MQNIFISGLFLAAVLTASDGDDDICNQLHAFEFAPRTLTQNESVRDWVEVRWVGGWLNFEKGWHLSCTHSNTSTSKKLCDWLSENTSFEFPHLLPERILQCHKFAFPQSIGINFWEESVSIYPEEGDRYLTLEVAVGGHKGDNSIRYSVFVGPAAAERNPLPPLFPQGDFVGDEQK